MTSPPGRGTSGHRPRPSARPPSLSALWHVACDTVGMMIGMRVMGLVALGATLMGCSSSVGGGGVAGSSVGDLIAQPDHFVVTVNLADGFAAPPADDRWELDVSARSL